MTTPFEQRALQIPADLLPRDGRFGSGPSRIFPTHFAAFSTLIPCDVQGYVPLMGTSHRQKAVKDVVARVREGLRTLYRIPEGWEVALGNGGATAFWSVATASLVRSRAAHASFGEFGAKFAEETTAAPFLSPSFVHSAPAGEVASLLDEASLAALSDEVSRGAPRPDVAAYPHHETSTGALSPLYRVSADTAAVTEDCLTVVDATSIAGALDVDVTATDVYYFSPQKAFASEGGLWVALLSPEAQERAREFSASTAQRWIPSFLNLHLALRNSVQEQTLNTPALATLLLLDAQIQWMLTNGGLAGMEARSRTATQALYDWACASSYASPFIAEGGWRSPVVATIDFDESVDALWLASVLRANGVVDVEPYRSLGRNQLRVACFPSTDLSDVQALISCIDWLVANRA